MRLLEQNGWERKHTFTYIESRYWLWLEALTTYGIIGVKVWIYKGELMAKDVENEKKERVKNATTLSELNLKSF